MTTEQQPAAPAAQAEESGGTAESEQPPTADAPTESSIAAADTAREETVPDGNASTKGTTPPSEQSIDEVPTSAGTATETPPRRVRLNPTISPEVARPIPNLRSDGPPPVTPAPPESESSDSSGPEEFSASARSPQKSDDEQDSILADTPAPEAPPTRPADPVVLPGRHESLDADLEAELEQAMAGDEQRAAAAVQAAEQAAAEAADLPPAPDAEVKRGKRLKGTVASIHGDDMFIDFGLRMAGVLSRRQFGLRKQPMQGEPLEVVVHRIDENEGLIHVNLPTGTSRVRGQWDALSVDQNVECMVTGTNKGGLEVSIGAVRGFMPASQVELGFVPDLSVYVGQRLSARIAEVNPKRRKLVLSRRALLEEQREQSQHEIFEKIQPGQQYTGRVRTLKNYGAFVDIGGADGLLHVAQICWSRINHPSEVLKEGEEIEVQVLSVDREKKKISLGMRQLTQNPWKSAESKFAQGTTVRGKVTRIENFGAFVELGEGVEGLVHISELDHKRVNKVTDVLRTGQEVDVQVLEVDTKRKRVSLSLKALQEKPEDPQEQRASSEPIKRQRDVSTLVGGMGEPTGGKLFGDPSKFGG